MKLVSLLVAFCFSLNVFASTGTVTELEKLMNDYHYALSVEWDQKDEAFHKAQTDEFFAKLTQLVKENGLSKEEMLKLAETKMNNKASFEALQLKLSVLSTSASNEELAKVIRDASKDMYARGANWNGDVIVPVVFGLVIAAVVGYAIWWSATHECVAYEQRYVCNTYDHCYGGYYGSGYYYGGYCYGHIYTSCGWRNVCTRYAKKQ